MRSSGTKPPVSVVFGVIAQKYGNIRHFFLVVKHKIYFFQKRALTNAPDCGKIPPVDMNVHRRRARSPDERFLLLPGAVPGKERYIEGGKRMTKYIFVTGGVVSGLGKGITAASLGRLLKARGLKVAAQKLDPYINVDRAVP